MGESQFDVGKLLDQLSARDLERLLEKAPQVIVDRKRKSILDLSERWQKEAEELGMTPQRLLVQAKKFRNGEGPEEDIVEKSSGQQKSQPKLRDDVRQYVPSGKRCHHPNDQELTWAGTGRIPNWLINLVNEGGRPVVVK